MKSSHATRNSLALRCWEPTWKTTPLRFAASTMTLPSETPSVIGFWQ